MYIIIEIHEYKIHYLRHIEHNTYLTLMDTKRNKDNGIGLHQYRFSFLLLFVVLSSTVNDTQRNVYTISNFLAT